MSYCGSNKLNKLQVGARDAFKILYHWMYYYSRASCINIAVMLRLCLKKFDQLTVSWG